MGASCTCNAAAAGSIPVLSTCDGRQSDRGAARSPGMREGSVRLRVTARPVVDQVSSNGRTLAFGSSNRGSNPRA
jgi:hypothetical protein